MNRDEVKGKAAVITGNVKQVLGDLTKNPALHDEGVADEATGKAQEAAGHLRRAVGEVITAIGDTVKKK